MTATSTLKARASAMEVLCGGMMEQISEQPSPTPVPGAYRTAKNKVG